MSDLIEAWVLAECHVVLQDLTQCCSFKLVRPELVEG